jgi:iron complex outermembrane receptor protein
MTQIDCPRSGRADSFRRRLPSRPLLVAILGGAWTFSAATATGQTADHVRELGELSMKELMELDVDSVYGASRYLQKARQAPSSITVVTAEEIRRLGARTLGDVLNGVRGLYAPNDRNYTYLGLRGFQRPGDYNTRVLVLIDGHRMNDNVYDQGFIGREGMVDVELIERVEVIRGPSSSVYGSSAFFGVVNVVTKRSSSLDGAEASVEAGSLGTYSARFAAGQVFDGGLEWLISASAYTSAGPERLYYAQFDERISDDSRAANNGVVEGWDGEDVQRFFTSVRYNDFSASAFWSGRTKEIPTASFDTMFNSALEQTEDDRSYIDFRYDHTLNERLDLQGRVFYDDYSYRGAYPYDFAEAGSPPDILVSRDRGVGRWVGTEWLVTARLPDRHTVIAGAEYRNNLLEFQEAYYELEPLVYDAYDRRSSDTLGIFMQSESVLTDNVTVTAGLRYDSYSDGVDTVNPRVGVILSPGEGSLKALYGEAFRAPNPYESHYYIAQQDQPAVNPETIRTYELVYEKRLLDRYRMTIAGYSYRVEDLVNQEVTPDGDIYFANLDSARARGLEFEIDRSLENGVFWRASYALQKAVDGETGADLSSSPRHIAKANFGVPLFDGRILTGLELQYHGSVQTVQSNRADDFLIANFTAFTRRTTQGLEISGNIRNLFDTRYGWPGAEDHLQDVIEQNGRTYQVKVSYRF